MIRGKPVFNFRALFLKMCIFEGAAFFLAYWLANQLNFSVAVHKYKINGFDDTAQKMNVFHQINLQ